MIASVQLADDALVLLTLACPSDVVETLIEQLDEHGFPHFTVFAAEGHGAGAQLASAWEQVRGRERRRIVQLVLHGGRVPALVDALAAEMPSPAVAWWTTPVLAFGTLA
jgi:hypothetical protein